MIIKSGTMTGKERVMRAFSFERVDRVPINYAANPGIHERLAKALGVRADYDAVDAALGVDFKGFMPRYTGPTLFEAPPNRRVDSMSGSVMRYVEHQSGGYWDYCDFPLAGADEETFDNWPVPNPDDFDYDELRERLKAERQRATFLGHAGMIDIMNSTGMICGMENTYMNLADGDEGFLRFVDRRTNYQLGVIERALDKCHDYVDFIWCGEDLGTQHTPLISLDLFRRELKPRHKKMVDLAASYGKPEMIHTCGSSSWAYEDFIEMGVRAVDTLQPEATNMSPEYLTEHFGGRLAFHGLISTARLSDLTVEGVDKDVRDTIEIMRKYPGYCLAPTHMIQDNTPVENVIAMYNAGYKYGLNT